VHDDVVGWSLEDICCSQTNDVKQGCNDDFLGGTSHRHPLKNRDSSLPRSCFNVTGDNLSIAYVLSTSEAGNALSIGSSNLMLPSRASSRECISFICSSRISKRATKVPRKMHM